MSPIDADADAMPMATLKKCTFSCYVGRRSYTTYDVTPRRYLRHHRGKHRIEMSGESESPQRQDALGPDVPS